MIYGNVNNDTGPDSFAFYGGFIEGNLFEAGDGTSTLTWTTILDNLAYGGVAITTIGSGVLSGDIDIQQGKTFTSSNSLGFFAHRNIQVGSGAHIVNEGTGDINMFAGWNEASGTSSCCIAVNPGQGDLTVNANITTLGEIFLQAGNDVNINNALISSGGPAAVYAHVGVNAYGGNVNINNSTVRARGGNTYEGFGELDIWANAGTVTVQNNSVLEAVGGNDGYGYGYGGLYISAGGNTTIENSTLTANGQSAWMDIYANGSAPAINLLNSSLSVVADGAEGSMYVRAVGAGSTINAGTSNLSVQGVVAEGGEGIYSSARLFADGNITLGQVSAPDVYVQSSSGAIIDGNAGLNIAANYMQLQAANGIGSVANPLETQGAYLYAYNSGGETGNEIGIINSGDLNIYSVYNSSGNIAVGATGSLTADGGEGYAGNGGSMLLAANGNLNILGGYLYSDGPMALQASGNIIIGSPQSYSYAEVIGYTGLTLSAGGNIELAPNIYESSALAGSPAGITTIASGGNLVVDRSTIFGYPDVVASVGGSIIISGTSDYPGKIEALSPSTLFLTFPSGTSGGFSVNGIEGLLFDGQTGFFNAGYGAVLNESIFITYGGAGLPVPSNTLEIPTENLIIAMGESTKPPDPEKDKDVFEDIEEKKKKEAPVCR